MVPSGHTQDCNRESPEEECGYRNDNGRELTNARVDAFAWCVSLPEPHGNIESLYV
jgi:hypothetical protein